MAATTSRVPYEQRGIRELRALARERGIVGFSRMHKDVLIDHLRGSSKPAPARGRTAKNGKRR